MMCVWFSFFTFGLPKTRVVVVSIASTNLLVRTSPNSMFLHHDWSDKPITYSQVLAFQDGCNKSDK